MATSSQTVLVQLCLRRLSSQAALPARGLIHLHDIVGLVGGRIEHHPFCHCCGMFGAQMAVGSSNEHAAVGVPEPFGNDLEVNAMLDGVAGEEMPECVVMIMRQAKTPAGRLNRLFSGLDGEDGIGRVGLATSP